MAKIFTPDGNTKDHTVDEFLNKTFFTSFKIPTPILSMWKKFLYETLDRAFTPNIPDEEKRLLSIIFSNSINIEFIKPREIIAYVNNLVSLYNQHKSKEIELPYLALCNQYKDEIREHPVDTILNFTPYKNMASLFEDEESLRGNVGAVFYNIPKEQAIEVILNNEIETLLRSSFNDETFNEKFKTISTHVQFATYADEVCSKINSLEEYRLKSVCRFVELSDNILMASTKTHIAFLIDRDIDKLGSNFTTIEDWHTYPILNFKMSISNRLIKTIIEKIKPKDADESSFAVYYESLIKLLQLKKQRKGLQVSPEAYVCSVDNFKKYYQHLKAQGLLAEFYDEMKILINKTEFDAYFTEHPTTSYHFYNSEALEDVELLEFLKGKKYDVAEIKKYNDSLMSQAVQEASTEVRTLIYRVNRIVNDKIVSVPINSYSVAVKAGTTTDVDVVASLLFMLSNQAKYASYESNIKTLLTTKDDVDITALCKVINNYMTFNDLIKLSLKYNGTLLIVNKLIRVITKNDVNIDRLLNSKYIFDNIGDVKSYIFNHNDQDIFVFVEEFDKWERFFAETLTEDVFGVSDFWIDNISSEYIEKYKSFKLLFDSWLKTFNEYSVDEWKSIFNQSSDGYAIFKGLSDEDLLNTSLWKQDNLSQGLKMAYEDYLISDADLDTDLVEAWEKSTTKTTKTAISNYLFDKLDTPNSVDIEKLYDFSMLLFPYSARVKTASHFNSFFDDYIMRILRECDIQKVAELINNTKKYILTIISGVDDERKELITTSFSTFIADKSIDANYRESINQFAEEAGLAINMTENEEEREMEKVG